MKATTKLQVPPGMVLDIHLQITAQEADEILKDFAAKEVRWYPTGQLGKVLRESLEAARMSHTSEHQVEP